MGAGRGRTLCALWGGISLGVGTVAFALFSSSSAGCSTNLVVLTHSAVTARGCAAFSVVAHVGVGLVVLGAVLLLGSFALTVRTRRHVPDTREAADHGSGAPGPVGVPGSETAVPPVPPDSAVHPAPPASPDPATPPEPVPTSVPVAVDPPAVVPGPTDPDAVDLFVSARLVEQMREPESVPVPEQLRARGRPIAPGEDVDGAGGWDVASPAPGVRLPPGWYGNPDNPGRPVQWWDGTKLTDHPD